MRSWILVIGIVMHFLILAAYAKYTVKKNAFYFDDGNAVKVSVMEENSLTYELYLPKDGRVRVSTTLGDGSKDSFVVNLNKSEITLENYLQSPDSEKPNMKAQGEYLLVNKNFEDRTFKIRRFIFINKEKNSSILSSNGSFIVEYLNEKILVNNSSDSATEILYFTLDLHRRELTLI